MAKMMVKIGLSMYIFFVLSRYFLIEILSSMLARIKGEPIHKRRHSIWNVD